MNFYSSTRVKDDWSIRCRCINLIRRNQMLEWMNKESEWMKVSRNKQLVS